MSFILLLLVLLVGVSACNSDEPIIDRGAFAAVVYGQVEETDGMPAVAVPLAFDVYADTACTRSVGDEADPVQSDSAGTYQGLIVTESPEAPCLRIEATSETDAGGDTSLIVQSLDVELRRQTPFDSARVDVTMPDQ